MKRVFALLAMAALAMSAFVVACGGDDDDDDGAGEATPGGSVTRTASGTGTPRTTGTPSPDATPGTNGDGGENGENGGSEPGEPVDPGGVQPETPEELTVVAGNPIFGGAEDATPVVVNPPPAVTPPAGTTPAADPTAVADPSAPGGELRLIIDANASEPGIQSSREVNVGDTFRVGVVVANAQSYSNDNGVVAMQFDMNYDKTVIFAPTIAGGPSVDRNPDLNQAGLGAGEWQCLPAAEGDKDDPGGMNGDGIPETGQAFLSCFTGTTGAQGTFVFGVVEFTAIASGTVDLSLSLVVLGDSLAVSVGQCPGDPYEAPVIPCDGARITVR